MINLNTKQVVSIAIQSENEGSRKNKKDVSKFMDTARNSQYAKPARSRTFKFSSCADLHRMAMMMTYFRSLSDGDILGPRKRRGLLKFTTLCDSGKVILRTSPLAIGIDVCCLGDFQPSDSVWG